MRTKVIPGFDYLISDLGVVYSIKFRKRIIKKPIIHKCRVYIWLWKNDKRYRFQVSRLVAKAFIKNPNRYPCVLHKNNDPLKNEYTNLKWVPKSKI